MLQLTFKRYEIKYLLTDEQRGRLGILMDRYMTPDEWGPSTVCNVYYDTPSHLLVRRSAEHPLYKEKVRTRSYGVNLPAGAMGVSSPRCSSPTTARRSTPRMTTSSA